MKTSAFGTTAKTTGFTLVEMMAVVVIIGILAAVIAPKMIGNINQTQDAATLQQIENLKKAVTFYRFHTNRFPEDLKDLSREPDGVKGWHGPYLERAARDPWDNPFNYRAPGLDQREFDIWSNGADGEEGTDDDLTSWEIEEG